MHRQKWNSHINTRADQGLLVRRSKIFHLTENIRIKHCNTIHDKEYVYSSLYMYFITVYMCTIHEKGYVYSSL